MIISLTLAQALDGFILARTADGMSPNTIRAYHWGLNRLVSFLPGCQLSAVTTDDLRRFLLHVRENDHLAPASLQIVWRTVKALFGWGAVEFGLPRPDLNLPMPRRQSRIIIAFSEDEINKLLHACEYTTPAATTGRQAFRMHRPTAHRDRAILLMLLDAGLRASELCRLTLQDVDLKTGEIEVRPYLSGRKSRPRDVYLGKNAGCDVWTYLATRKDNPATPRGNGAGLDP